MSSVAHHPQAFVAHAGGRRMETAQAALGRLYDVMMLLACLLLLVMVGSITLDVVLRNVALPGLPRGFPVSNDISEYALMHCEPEVVGRLHLGSAIALPFPAASFQAVISINTIHNLERQDAVRAVREIERLAPGRGFIQVDSYRTPEQREVFLQWVLTARFHDYPPGWLELFAEAGYTGYYYWTVVE